MLVKFCLPIIKQTKEELLADIEKHSNTYDLFEIWVDHLEAIDTIFLNELCKKLQNKLIIVFRRKNGEKIVMSFDQRKEIIKIAIKHTCLIDLDIEEQKEDMEYIKDKNARVIASFHNYENTPRTSSLVKIIADMRMFDPEIYKIATFCKTKKQAISLLHLLLDLKEQGKRAIILGMGENGQITRIFGSLWGNEMIFAPADKESTNAPGQLTIKQLKDIFAIVR